jgi:hypothetical protein
MIRLACVLALVATGGVPAVADAQVLARTAAPYGSERVSLDGWGGTIAFSQFDSATHGYRLAVIAGGAPELLPVAPQTIPFDVDVGPGPDGRPLLVYARCTNVAGPLRFGCDLYRYSFTTRAETPIAGANTSLEEIAPTVWKDQVAFARTRSVAGERALPRVYARPLDEPGARSRRLPVMPGRPTAYGSVEELELHGGRLAAVVRAGPGSIDAPDVEVRLLDGATVRRVARTGVGAISVRKMFAGLTFEGDRLSYARAYFYSSADAVYRYDIGTRRTTSAPLPRTTYGLAAAGGRRYLRLGTAPGTRPGAADPMPLELARTAPLRFAPARAPR